MLDVRRQDRNHMYLEDGAQTYAEVQRTGSVMQVDVHGSLTMREALQLALIISEVATHGGN